MMIRPTDDDLWKCDNCGSVLCYFENCHVCGPTCLECIMGGAKAVELKPHALTETANRKP